MEIHDWNVKALAKEIYENIGQLLSLAKLQIASLNLAKKNEVKKVIDSSERLLEKAIKDLRKLSRLLTPEEIMQKGFAASLKEESEKLNHATPWKMDLHFEGRPFRLNETRELILFSLLQHYIMKALYIEKAGSISVAVLYKIMSIDIRISYIEIKKIIPEAQERKETGTALRAKLIRAGNCWSVMLSASGLTTTAAVIPPPESIDDCMNSFVSASVCQLTLISSSMFELAVKSILF